MRRTLLAAACVSILGGGIAGAQTHPQHQRAQLVSVDVPGPPTPTATTNPVPILFAPTTTTTTAPPPTTAVTAPKPPPPRPVRPATPRPARPIAQASPQPVDGDLAFPPNCLSGAFWASFHQTSDKIPYAHQCWDQLLAKYPWSTSTAFSVMMCESEGNPAEVNGSGATGLMQVITKGASTEPNQNMRQAWAKYTGAGNSWGPWSPSSYCSSRKQKG